VAELLSKIIAITCLYSDFNNLQEDISNVPNERT